MHAMPCDRNNTVQGFPPEMYTILIFYLKALSTKNCKPPMSMPLPSERLSTLSLWEMIYPLSRAVISSLRLLDLSMPPC